jgi:hypothetical protein
VRSGFCLGSEYYTRILTKRGRFGLLAIQDAAEEDGGGFNAETERHLGRTRMRVLHGPHIACERHRSSGPKELAFVRNNIRSAAELFATNGHELLSPDNNEACRQHMLQLIDPHREPVKLVGQLLLFTDSTVFIFAGRKGYSNSPEMEAILDEITITLMETGLVACIKHLPGKTMIRVHVDGASRRNAAPLLRVQDVRELHPFLLHQWGVTEALRKHALLRYPTTIFVGMDEGIEWGRLSGTTFCIAPYPEAMVPVVMRALEVWTSRPSSSFWHATLARLASSQSCGSSTWSKPVAASNASQAPRTTVYGTPC